MKLLFSVVAALFVFCVLMPFETPGQARGLSGQVFTVDSIGDSFDATAGDGICADVDAHCTLRAAIDEANTTEATDAIIFWVPHGSAIELVLGELVISKTLLMAGPGAKRLAIGRSLAAGTQDFRVFRVTGLTTYSFMYGVTVRNGRTNLSGGAILVETGSSLAVYDAAIKGNHASIGGGIANFGSVSLHRCAFVGNSADALGGAIANVAPGSLMTIISSTLTQNAAQTGGAIYHAMGELTLANTTISQNSATIASTSIDVQTGGVVKVINTLIGRDTSKDRMALSGAFQSFGHNIVTDSRGSTGFRDGFNGDQVSEKNLLDPMLGPLTDKGGQTDVLPTLPESPAIGEGDMCVVRGNCPLPIPAAVWTDQRRLNRTLKDETIDVGAYEGTATPMADGTVGIGYEPPLLPSTFYANSPAVLINPTTLERYHSILRLKSQVVLVPSAEVYILHIRSKRQGLTTPSVTVLD